MNGNKMTKINKKINKSQKTPIKEYMEFYFSKYKTLSSCDLTILIHAMSKSELKFNELQKYIATQLTSLKNQKKVIKVGNKQWTWIEAGKVDNDDMRVNTQKVGIFSIVKRMNYPWYDKT